MGLPKTVRLEEQLDERVEKYLVANGIKFSNLINLVPVDTKEFMKTAEKAFKKHKDAMDKLK